MTEVHKDDIGDIQSQADVVPLDPFVFFLTLHGQKAML